MGHYFFRQCTFWVILISAITISTPTPAHSNGHSFSTKLSNRSNSSAGITEVSATHQLLLYVVVIGLLLVALCSLLLIAFTCLMCFRPPICETVAITNDPVLKMLAAAQTTASTVTASTGRENVQHQQKVKAVKTKIMAKTPTGKGKGGGSIVKKAPSSSSARVVSKQAAVTRKSSSRMSKHKRAKMMPGDVSGKHHLSKLKAKSTQMGNRKKRRG